MTKNLKYQWCKENAGSIKEFLGWVYDRLQYKLNDPYECPYMKRLEAYIDILSGTIPDGSPITIDIVDNKPVTILRHGKIIYSEVDKCP